MASAWLCTPACAGPWIHVGDEQARHHLLNLRDSGAINIPLSTWPLPWADVAREIANITYYDLNASQAWSLRYLKHALQRAQRHRTSSKRLHVSNSLTPFTHFGSDVRDDVILASESNFMGENLVLNISAKALQNPTDNDSYQLDGSYVAATAANWILGFGSIERWWGPGWQSSLILSNNARPGTGVFLRRKETLKPETPILDKIGAWTVDFFAERLHAEQGSNDNNFFGARFSTSPTHNLQLGISGTLLVGRSEDNAERPALAEALPTLKNGERYKQISYDARLKIMPRLAAYGQYLAVSRSSNQGFNGQYSHSTLLGLETSFMFFDVHNRVFFEMSNTGSTESSESLSGYYPGLDDVYQHRGRSIGESAGYLGRRKSLAGEHFFANGHQLSWRLVERSEARYQQMGEINYSAPVNTYLKASLGLVALKNRMMLGAEEVLSGSSITLEFRF